jgi:hypothetical protein
MLLPGTKATHPHSKIRHSICFTPSQRYRYRGHILHTHKILPYTKPPYLGQCPSVGDSCHTLADIYAPRYSDSYIFHESYHAFLLLLWYQCCQQSKLCYEHHWIHHARSACDCLGCWGGAFQDGKHRERSLGILLQFSHGPNTSRGRELPGLWEAL